jgi:hypothetical protein
MKTLKFEPHLAALMLKAEKTATWRLYDDKALAQGDEISCINRETGKEFGTAIVERLSIKPLGQLDDEDWQGHERFTSEEEMYKTYQSYYPNEVVNADTLVKILHLNFTPLPS